MKRSYVNQQRSLLKNTYAQKQIQVWLSEKKTKEIWDKYLSDSIGYFYFLANVCKNATTFPPLISILNLRDVIPPALWFYTVDEPLPDVSFNNLKNWDYRKSKNFKKLKNIMKKKQIVKWSEENSQSFPTIWALVNETRLLIPRRIFDMRKALPPEDWFR